MCLYKHMRTPLSVCVNVGITLRVCVHKHMRITLCMCINRWEQLWKCGGGYNSGPQNPFMILISFLQISSPVWTGDILKTEDLHYQIISSHHFPPFSVSFPSPNPVTFICAHFLLVFLSLSYKTRHTMLVHTHL